MKIRKKLSTCIGLIAAATMLCSISASAFDDTSADDYATQHWVEDTTDFYSVIAENFSQTPNSAGCYFEGDILYLSTTNIDETKNFLAELADRENLTADDLSHVGFNEVEHTYAELSETRDYFAQNFASLGVVGAYTNPEDNTVIVETNSPSSAQAISSCTYSSRVNVDNVIFDPVGDLDVVDDATYIRGGAAINDTTQGKGFSFGSMIKWNSTGKYGFLTASHGSVQVGDTFKYSGTEIGSVVTSTNSSSIDAALIERTNNSYVGSTLNGDAGMVCTKSGSPIVNETVTMFGRTTGSSTGTILATDYSVGSYTGLIKTDCVSQSGDSGGPIIASRSTGNVFVGINKGHTVNTPETWEIATSWPKIRDKYNLSRVSNAEK